ncbi:MAG: 50S ribosomal protein L6 [Anaerolineae bacterium]
MSRIGRMPVSVPDKVQVSIDGNHVKVKGPKGELEREFHPTMRIKRVDDELVVERPDDSRQSRALHGLTRALLANMVTGVTEGYRKQLEINGVGFRAEEKGQGLVLQIGYSHPVEVNPPEGISVRAESSGRVIVVEGIDKELVGQVAARIRAVRKPEPYKGKGIAYAGERIRRKAGKAGRAGGI